MDHVCIENYVTSKQPNRYIYNTIISKYAIEQMQSYLQYYNTCIDKLSWDDYMLSFRNLYKITQITSLRSFQYRCLIGKIFTRVTLYKWKISSTAECMYCYEAHTIKHLFWECPRTVRIWKEVQKMFPTRFDWSYHKITICKMAPHGHIVNLVLLITKYYLYACFCKQESYTPAGLIKTVQSTRRMEIFNAIDKDKIRRKWAEVNWPEGRICLP